MTLPTSDSLSGTTSFIALRSLSTANEELDEPVEPEEDEADELAPPVAADPRPLAPVVPSLLPDEACDALDARLVPPPETVSPTSPESETIVPLSGARSRVSATDCSSLLTVSRSLLTAARAEAMFASRVAALIVAPLLVEPLPVEPLPVEPLPVDPPLLVPDVEERWGLVVGARFFVACVAEIEATAALAELEPGAPEPDAPEPPEPVPEPEPSPSVSSSRARFASADCRLAFACSSVTSALCGSSVAMSCPWATCSPCVTSICVTVPLVLKPRSSWLAASMLPLPETVDCTTPRCATTVLVVAEA